LSSTMIVRGSVPAHVLFGGEAPPPRPQATHSPPTSLRDISATVVASLAQDRTRPPTASLSALASVVSLKAERDRAPQTGPRKSITVRLDPVHHMRLRLVGSYLRRSAQDIMVEALNSYLDTLPQEPPGDAGPDRGQN